MPMLVSKSSKTKWIDAAIVPIKGDETEYSISVMKDAVIRMGHAEFIHKSDQEACLKNLKETAIKALEGTVEAIPEESPTGASQANGSIETGVQQIEGLVRTHRDAAEQAQGIRIEGDSPLIPWLVQWCAFVYNRFSLDVNGRTP